MRVGHAGTLDPFATGLLLVLVGRATRVQRFLMGLPKTYRTVVRLGWRSSTGDRDGELERTGRIPDQIELPTGSFLQRPPAYSAVKVAGEPLYRRARRGEPVEGEPRTVTVHRWALLWHEGERAALEIECSAGTYVRQLVAGLGDAYCEELERTAIGPFRLEQADPDRLLPLEEALTFLPEQELADEEARRVAHGVAVVRAQTAEDRGQRIGALPSAAGAAGALPSPVRLTHHGTLLALAEPRGDTLKPTVVLHPR